MTKPNPRPFVFLSRLTPVSSQTCLCGLFSFYILYDFGVEVQVSGAVEDKMFVNSFFSVKQKYRTGKSSMLAVLWAIKLHVPILPTRCHITISGNYRINLQRAKDYAVRFTNHTHFGVTLISKILVNSHSALLTLNLITRVE